jgi:hypothetical protein
MKTGRRGHRALSDEFQQAEGTQMIEYVRALRPRNLTVLRAPERLEYGFVRIRGHLVLSSCAAMTASLAGGQRPLAAPTKRGMPRIQSQCRVAAKDRNTQPPLALGAAFLFQAPVCTHADRALYRKSADAFLETR